MPPVYTFSRSEAEIREELVRVFSAGSGTAREQWSLQAELVVEPVGWDALWKLSKEFCKKFGVRFPCIAFISVSSVDFDSLTANIEVESVQHESVSLPESMEEVPLIELWPTIKQREQCVNAATTAEFIDLMRFFYTNIWMPWDDQDDKLVLPNTIEDRMQLFVELHNGQIPACIARSIVLLRNSAINAFERLKVLDLSLCDDDLSDDDSLLPPNYIVQCAEMTARLDSHMSQWTLYEKSLIRDQYVAKLKSRFQKNKGMNNVVVLWQGGTGQEFQQLSQYVTQTVDVNSRLCIAEDAERALRLEPTKLVISGRHALPETPLAGVVMMGHNGGEVVASDVRSYLLMLSDDCEVSDIRMSCGAVSTALAVRGGRLRLTRCRLLDDTEHTQTADFAQGIVAMAGAHILIEDCVFENFYSGIVIHKGAKVEIRNSTIKNCGVGIQMYSGSSVRLDGTAVTACAEHALRREVDCDIGDVDNQELQIMPNCTIGSGDLQRDVLVVKQDVNLC